MKLALLLAASLLAVSCAAKTVEYSGNATIMTETYDYHYERSPNMSDDDYTDEELFCDIVDEADWEFQSDKDTAKRLVEDGYAEPREFCQIIDMYKGDMTKTVRYFTR